MNEITRSKLNSLRPPLLQLALANMSRKPGALPQRYYRVAFSSGLGEAFVQRRDDKAAARAKGKVARNSRKVNRQRRKAGMSS